MTQYPLVSSSISGVKAGVFATLVAVVLSGGQVGALQLLLD